MTPALFLINNQDKAGVLSVYVALLGRIFVDEAEFVYIHQASCTACEEVSLIACAGDYHGIFWSGVRTSVFKRQCKFLVLSSCILRAFVFCVCYDMRVVFLIDKSTGRGIYLERLVPISQEYENLALVHLAFQ